MVQLHVAFRPANKITGRQDNAGGGESSSELVTTHPEVALLLGCAMKWWWSLKCQSLCPAAGVVMTWGSRLVDLAEGPDAAEV